MTEQEWQREMRRRAQELRKRATKEEIRLWRGFLCSYPVRFARQYRVGNYILDFYCRSAKLAVELDGSQHYEPAGEAKDAVRTKYLESRGIRVIRFSNREVMQNFRGVCEAIDFAVHGEW